MSHWPTRKLGDVCELVNGAPFKPSDWDGAGLPIVRIQNLNDPSKPFNYTSKTLPEKFRVRPGATLLSWSGTPGTSFGCFRWNGPEGWLNQHIFNVHLSEDVLPPFFIYQVNSKLDELIGKAHGGVGLQHITKGALSSVNITVPPLPEQQRIVKLLDEADELRKLRAQADRRMAQLVPALFHEMFGDPLENPMGWSVTPFGNLASNQDGRRKPVKASDRAERKGQYPYYGASGIIDYLEEYLFDGMALLIAEDGANLLARSSPIAFLAHGKYWVNNHAHVVIDIGSADLNYLCVALNLRDVADYVTGSAQPKLTQANLNRILIPVPPLSLQREFALRVAEIREMEAAQAISRRRLDDLFQSMLHRAFTIGLP
jgi:type I restriction enzyme S subunit